MANLTKEKLWLTEAAKNIVAHARETLRRFHVFKGPTSPHSDVVHTLRTLLHYCDDQSVDFHDAFSEAADLHYGDTPVPRPAREPLVV